MFEMSTQTWGPPDKWKKASAQLRFEIVKKILKREALPLALEAPYFSFQIENVSRAAFDQIARTRIGVVYAARGFKDNNLNYLDFIIPNRIKKLIVDDEERQELMNFFQTAKHYYKEFQESDIPNWANRCVIPMYACYNFIMVMHYKTLQQFCASRMQTSEMEDTVGVAWLMREAVKKEFPLLAEYLRPQCDWSGKDTTVQVNGFADILGIIHNSDNRQPGFNKKKYDIRHEEPCTDIKYLQKALKIKIPKPNQWKDYKWTTLSKIDKKLFNN